MEAGFRPNVDIGDAGLVVVFESADFQFVKINQLFVQTHAQVPRGVSRVAQADDGFGSAAAGVNDVCDNLVERVAVD